MSGAVHAQSKKVWLADSQYPREVSARQFGASIQSPLRRLLARQVVGVLVLSYWQWVQWDHHGKELDIVAQELKYIKAQRDLDV